jgi:imidazolonepropionase-like amidohydrolase
MISSSIPALFGRLLFCLLVLSSQVAWAQERGDVLIRGGTVLTVTEGTLENTDVLVRNGRIERIGSALSAPSGVTVVDASGRYVMPGIIDAHAHIAISEVNEATNPVTAEVTVADVINPYDINLYRATAGRRDRSRR